MGNYQQELLNVAQRVAAMYAIDPNVDAVLLTGSVALGKGDAASDVDMSVYYRTYPPEAEIEQIKESALASGGGIYSHEPEQGLAVYHFVDGSKVDTGHIATSGMEEMVAGFVAEPSASNTTLHIVMSGVQQGRALYGEPVIRDWQERLSPMGSQMREALVGANLRFAPLAVMMDMGVDRADFGFVYEELGHMVARLLNVWCGLNGRIPPGKIKGMAVTLAHLPVLPNDAAGRVESLYTLPPRQAVQALYRLIEETLGLVEHHLPEIDTGRTRQMLSFPLRKALWR